jgi:hypothetical protein
MASFKLALPYRVIVGRDRFPPRCGGLLCNVLSGRNGASCRVSEKVYYNRYRILDIEIFNFEGMFFDEFAARFNFVAHEDTE